MGRDRAEKPSVVSCPAIKSDNGSEPRICLNPSTIADVCEHVDATGRNSNISWGQIPVIHLLNGSGDSNGARVIAVTFPQRLRAGIKPPLLKIAAKCAPVEVPSSVCQKGIAECSPGQSRAIDSSGTLSSPKIFRAFEFSYTSHVVLSKFIRINLAAGKDEWNSRQRW